MPSPRHHHNHAPLISDTFRRVAGPAEDWREAIRQRSRRHRRERHPIPLRSACAHPTLRDLITPRGLVMRTNNEVWYSTCICLFCTRINSKVAFRFQVSKHKVGGRPYRVQYDIDSKNSEKIYLYSKASRQAKVSNKDPAPTPTAAPTPPHPPAAHEPAPYNLKHMSPSSADAHLYATDVALFADRCAYARAPTPSPLPFPRSLPPPR